MKRLMLGLLTVLATVGFSAKSDAGFSTFNPSAGQPSSQFDDVVAFSTWSFSNFVGTDTVTISLLPGATATFRAYKVDYNFVPDRTAGWNNSNSVAMGFQAALSGGWEFAAYNVKKQVGGFGNVYNLAGTATGAGNVFGSSNDTGDGTYTGNVSTSLINGSIVDWNGGGSRTFDSFNVSFAIIKENNPVPEPGTMAVFGLLSLGGAVSRLRRKK